MYNFHLPANTVPIQSVHNEGGFTMTTTDTISLLRECNAGTQMAVFSINEIMENVKEPSLELLSAAKEQHERLGNEIHVLLQQNGDETKDPGAVAKGMSWLKTNAKLALHDSDRVCAGLVTDGCHMGIKTIQRYLNEYLAADKISVQKAQELIKIEEKLVEALKPYL